MGFFTRKSLADKSSSVGASANAGIAVIQRSPTNVGRIVDPCGYAEAPCGKQPQARPRERYSKPRLETRSGRRPLAQVFEQAGDLEAGASWRADPVHRHRGSKGP